MLIREPKKVAMFPAGIWEALRQGRCRVKWENCTKGAGQISI